MAASVRRPARGAENPNGAAAVEGAAPPGALRREEGVELSREVWGCQSDSGVVAMLFSSHFAVQPFSRSSIRTWLYKAFITMYGQMTLDDVRSNIEMFSFRFLT